MLINLSLPADGVYSPWSEWSPCSKTCGPGNVTRISNCSLAVNTGRQVYVYVGNLMARENTCVINFRFVMRQRRPAWKWRPAGGPTNVV